jgi:hypothetical protein
MTDKLVAVVAGMQHSGTTYLNEVINSHSKIMSGFECGILLNSLENFHTVSPFNVWLKTNFKYFGLPDDYLLKIKNMTYPQVYAYIAKNKGSKCDSLCQKLIKYSPYFTDKTPAYIYELENIYQKLSSFSVPIPIFIVLKSYEEIYKSWVIKRKIDVSHFHHKILKCIESLKFMEKSKKPNIFLFEYSDLINKSEKYNEVIMRIIKKFNNHVKLENLSKEKFNKKIKDSSVYDGNSKNQTPIQIADPKYKNEYNQLLNNYNN